MQLKFKKNNKIVMVEKDDREIVVLDEDLRKSFDKESIKSDKGKKNE